MMSGRAQSEGFSPYLFVKSVELDDSVVSMGRKNHLELVMIGTAVYPLGVGYV